MSVWVSRFRATVLLLTPVLLIAGCGDTGGPPQKATPTPGEKKEGHAHPGEGPHHGALVEWGDEEYHAEFTADRERGEVAVYVLGGDAETAAPIKADKVRLTGKDPAFQIDLKPAPEKTDPPGTASKFVGRLPEDTRGRRLSGTISAVVDGKPYSGDFRERPPHKD